MRGNKFDRKGNPLELMEWARLMEQDDYKRVAETTLPDGTRISTVWLGLDHGFGNGPPLVFETMVFPKDNGTDDCERYSTEEEARAGHEAMVAKWTAERSDAPKGLPVGGTPGCAGGGCDDDV